MNEMITTTTEQAAAVRAAEEIMLVGAVPAVWPLDPVVATARVVGHPVEVLETCPLVLTDRFTWVKFRPYGRPDPVALVPCWDFGWEFCRQMGDVVRPLAMLDLKRMLYEAQWRNWYERVQTCLEYFAGHALADNPFLEPWERRLVVDLLEEWAADPRALQALVDRTALPPP